jgi:phosphate:Na+ symporter
MVSGLLGGIGLFLLGMHMLTEGLKLAAGRALEDLLERGTSTPQRGLATGITITALVQSSSAVTVASIGFVNTGLLPLKNALWVIFGSNVGTTLNAWLVATLGFSFRIDTFALPFVGIGAGLMLAGRSVRLRALGQALAGFGVLFLGIDVLKDSFSALGGQLDLRRFIAPGLGGTLLMVALGTVLTVLMQASGAVIALVITAAESGLMPVEAACAMVIGTNIGTTFTAVLAAVSATANARRLAAAHVFFNLVTGAVALPLLPLLLAMLGLAQAWFGQPATPAVLVALFHSVFNVLGVLLMFPLVRGLLSVLSGRFRTREEETSRPRYLDDNAIAVPDLALRALRMELGRTQGLVSTILDAAAATPPDEAGLRQEAEALQAIAPAIGAFAHKLSGVSLPPGVVEALARALRVLQYQQNAADAARRAGALGHVLGKPSEPDLTAAIDTFRAALDALAASADAERPGFSAAAVDIRLAEAETHYARLKEILLRAGAHARLDIRTMQDWLQLVSLQRRATEQTAKAARMLATLVDGGPPPAEPGADTDDGAFAANGG